MKLAVIVDEPVETIVHAEQILCESVPETLTDVLNPDLDVKQ